MANQHSHYPPSPKRIKKKKEHNVANMANLLSPNRNLEIGTQHTPKGKSKSKRTMENNQRYLLPSLSTNRTPSKLFAFILISIKKKIKPSLNPHHRAPPPFNGHQALTYTCSRKSATVQARYPHPKEKIQKPTHQAPLTSPVARHRVSRTSTGCHADTQHTP